MLDDIIARAQSPEATRYSWLFLFRSRRRVIALGVLSGGAQSTRWRHSRLASNFCFSTSPPIISTCARKMCCLKRSPHFQYVVFGIARSLLPSTGWRRAFLKWRWRSYIIRALRGLSSTKECFRRRSRSSEKQPSSANQNCGIGKFEAEMPASAVPPLLALLAPRPSSSRCFEPARRKRPAASIHQAEADEDRVSFLEESPRIESAIAHTEQQLGVYISPQRRSG